jgi:hypothetical protein
MITSHIQLTLEGIDLEVTYTVYYGCQVSYNEPADADDLTVDSVEADGIDILPLLADWAVEACREAAWEDVREEATNG